MKTIYRVGSPFLKSQRYLDFTGQYKYQNIFATVDPNKPGHHRRLIALTYSEKSVSNMEPFIIKNVHLATARIADEMKAQGFCDVLKWFAFMVGCTSMDSFSPSR